MNKFVISLENLWFYSRIGVLEHERLVGNEFIVTITISADASGFVSEDLNSTINYASVYEIAREVMGKEWLLLESVAKQIALVILRRFSMAEEISVKILKVKPPIAGIQGSCSVEYLTSRQHL